MGKIFRLNKTGTLGVTLNKAMKAAGYEQGKPVVWEATTSGFILKIAIKPSEPAKEPTPQPGV